MLERRQRARSAQGQGSDTALFLSVSRAAKTLNRHLHWQDGIQEFLQALGEHTGASRVWLFEVPEQGEDYYVTRYVSEWAAHPGLSNFSDPLLAGRRVEVRDRATRELYQARLRGELLAHQATDAEGEVRREFERQGIDSMLTIPLMLHNAWWGILGFDYCDGPRRFPESYVAALEVAGLLLTNAIMHERLHWQANHDPLTQLYNRRYLLEYVNRALDPQNPEPGRLLILDLDWFKRVNDTFGHQAGDRALEAVADLLRQVLPKEAVPSRMGGEEFAIWVPDAASAGMELAERIRTAIEGLQLDLNDGRPQLSVSIGMAHSQAGGERFEALFARADEALFQAKRGGRNQVVVADA